MNDRLPGSAPQGPGYSQTLRALAERALGHLMGWPKQAFALLRDPAGQTAQLPAAGAWESLLTWVGASYLILGLWLAILEGSLSALLQTLSAGALLYFGGALVLDLGLGFLQQRPGYYRCAHFLALLTPPAALGAMLGELHPLFSAAAAGLIVYLLYHFLRQAGGLSKRQAGIVVAVLGALLLASVVTRYRAQSPNADDAVVNILSGEERERREMKKAIRDSLNEMEQR